MSPNEAVAAALESLAKALREAPHGQEGVPVPASPAGDRATAGTAAVALPWSVLLWREDLVPAEALLTVAQVMEATGLTKAALYRRTSAWHRAHDDTGTALPHVRVAGSLRFPAGQLRTWLREQAVVVVAPRAPVVVSRKVRAS